MALAAIWAQVLGLARVGVRDNFFDLGGDSILSIQIIARANQAGLRLTAKQIFQHQTIADLARAAEAATASEEPRVPGPVPPPSETRSNLAEGELNARDLEALVAQLDGPEPGAR